MPEDRCKVVAFEDDPFASPPDQKRYAYPRTLRTYRRMAQEFHWCDRCCTHIEPGEEYEARVEIIRRGQISVWKNHINPSCDYPDDPDYMRDDVEDEDSEDEAKAA